MSDNEDQQGEGSTGRSLSSEGSLASLHELDGTPIRGSSTRTSAAAATNVSNNNKNNNNDNNKSPKKEVKTASPLIPTGAVGISAFSSKNNNNINENSPKDLKRKNTLPPNPLLPQSPPDAAGSGTDQKDSSRHSHSLSNSVGSHPNEPTFGDEEEEKKAKLKEEKKKKHHHHHHHDKTEKHHHHRKKDQEQNLESTTTTSAAAAASSSSSSSPEKKSHHHHHQKQHSRTHSSKHKRHTSTTNSSPQHTNKVIPSIISDEKARRDRMAAELLWMAPTAEDDISMIPPSLLEHHRGSTGSTRGSATAATAAAAAAASAGTGGGGDESSTSTGGTRRTSNFGMTNNNNVMGPTIGNSVAGTVASPTASASSTASPQQQQQQGTFSSSETSSSNNNNRRLLVEISGKQHQQKPQTFVDRFHSPPSSPLKVTSTTSTSSNTSFAMKMEDIDHDQQSPATIISSTTTDGVGRRLSISQQFQQQKEKQEKQEFQKQKHLRGTSVEYFVRTEHGASGASVKFDAQQEMMAFSETIGHGRVGSMGGFTTSGGTRTSQQQQSPQQSSFALNQENNISQQEQQQQQQQQQHTRSSSVQFGQHHLRTRSGQAAGYGSKQHSRVTSQEVVPTAMTAADLNNFNTAGPGILKKPMSMEFTDAQLAAIEAYSGLPSPATTQPPLSPDSPTGRRKKSTHFSEQIQEQQEQQEQQQQHRASHSRGTSAALFYTRMRPSSSSVSSTSPNGEKNQQQQLSVSGSSPSSTNININNNVVVVGSEVKKKPGALSENQFDSSVASLQNLDSTAVGIAAATTTTTTNNILLEKEKNVSNISEKEEEEKEKEQQQQLEEEIENIVYAGFGPRENIDVPKIPHDYAWKQNTLPSIRFYIDAWWSAALMILVVVTCFPLGSVLLDAADRSERIDIRYDHIHQYRHPASYNVSAGESEPSMPFSLPTNIANNNNNNQETSSWLWNTTIDGVEHRQGIRTLLRFNVTRKLTAPVLLSYGLTKFHQNHLNVYQSKSFVQTSGAKIVSELDTASCQPLLRPGILKPVTENEKAEKSKTKIYVDGTFFKEYHDFMYLPCGSLPWSMFNDSFVLWKVDENNLPLPANSDITSNSSIYALNTSVSGVSLVCNSSDFDQVGNRKLITSPTLNPCTKATIDVASDRYRNKAEPNLENNDGILWSNPLHKAYNTTDVYLKNGWYADEPGHEVPALHDKDFQMWMRVAPLDKFRKILRVINTDMAPGQYQLEIDEFFDSTTFGGEKFISLEVRTSLGGGNFALPILYLVTGTVALILLVATVVQKTVSSVPTCVPDAASANNNADSSSTSSMVMMEEKNNNNKNDNSNSDEDDVNNNNNNISTRTSIVRLREDNNKYE